MADEENKVPETELNFDQTKRKKKKKIINLDEILPDDSEKKNADLREEMDNEANEALFGMEEEPDNEEELELPTKPKSKKKPKKPKNLDDMLSEKPAGEVDDVIEDFDDLSLMKKKKKGRRVVEFDDEVEEGGEKEAVEIQSERPWLDREDGNDPYFYKELLTRAFKIIRKNNPDIDDAKKKLVMRPPQISRIGTKKTCFVNFNETAKQLNRDRRHLMAYIFAELGTTGNQDQSEQLILKGKFQPKGIEKVLRGYIKEYVQCKTCRSSETNLDKKERLYFLKCTPCHSEYSVAAIKTGFQAVIGKRARIRTALAAAKN